MEMDDLFGYEGDGTIIATWQDVNPNLLRKQTGTYGKDQYFPNYSYPSRPYPGFTFNFALPTSTTRRVPVWTKFKKYQICQDPHKTAFNSKHHCDLGMCSVGENVYTRTACGAYS